MRHPLAPLGGVTLRVTQLEKDGIITLITFRLKVITLRRSWRRMGSGMTSELTNPREAAKKAAEGAAESSAESSGRGGCRGALLTGREGEAVRVATNEVRELPAIRSSFVIGLITVSALESTCVGRSLLGTIWVLWKRRAEHCIDCSLGAWGGEEANSGLLHASRTFTLW